MAITAQDTKLKPGYKQTEVGVIPEDWKVKRLEELGSWKGGATPSMANASFWNNGTIYWASSGDIKTRMLSKTASMITEIAVKQSNTTLLQEGAILIVTRSGILRKYLPVAKNTVPMAINQDIKALIPNSQVNADYLLQILSKCGPDILSTCMKAGTTVESVEYTWLKKYQIPLPSPPEQYAIAATLSEVDALITSLDKLIAKKRDIKQATMQQLLTGTTRVPGFSREWELKTFGEVMTGFASGATPSRNRPDFFKGDIRWITSGELNYNVIMDTIEKISVEAVSKTNLKLLPKGTFLMAITGLEAEGTRGSCGIVGAEATTNQSCMALFPTKELSTHYLFHYYVYKGKSLALQYCQGTKQQSYTGKIVKLLPILLPRFNEQEAIATILSDINAEIAALEQQREKTRALKQGMMQELLTGKTRLI